MILYFCVFGCFLIFAFWLGYEIKKSDRRMNQSDSDFWQKESAANQVRRVPRDTLPYIRIPLEQFPIGKYPDDALAECESSLLALSKKEILNLTGKTATQLKEAYGVANLSFVDQCDMNYTELAKTIAAYGARLCELGFEDDAVTVLEFGIDILTDISSNYKLLAMLYQKRKQPEKISQLKNTAERMDSLMKNSILNTLNTFHTPE